MDEFELTGSYRALGTRFAEHLDAADRSLAAVSPELLEPPEETLEFAEQCVPHVAEHLPGVLDELDAIAAATGHAPEAVRAVPLAVDADLGCSLVAVSGDRAPDGGPLFGRNLDFHPSFRRYSKCYRTRPEDGLASVGCGFTFGGRLDGVNEAGLAVGFAGVPTDGYEPGVSWPLAIRAVLDTCESVADATALLEGMTHLRNVNFLLADAGGDVAVVEAGPEAVRTTRPGRDWTAVTNQFPSAEMRAHQSEARDPADCPRLRTVEDLLEEGDEALSLLELQTLMGDPGTGVCWPLDLEDDDPRSTVWSWAMALGAGKARLAKGSPVSTRYGPVAVPRAAEHV